MSRIVDLVRTRPLRIALVALAGMVLVPLTAWAIIVVIARFEGPEQTLDAAADGELIFEITEEIRGPLGAFCVPPQQFTVAPSQPEFFELNPISVLQDVDGNPTLGVELTFEDDGGLIGIDEFHLDVLNGEEPFIDFDTFTIEVRAPCIAPPIATVPVATDTVGRLTQSIFFQTSTATLDQPGETVSDFSIPGTIRIIAEVDIEIFGLFEVTVPGIPLRSGVTFEGTLSTQLTPNGAVVDYVGEALAGVDTGVLTFPGDAIPGLSDGSFNAQLVAGLDIDAFLTTAGVAQSGPNPRVAGRGLVSRYDILAKAKPDECFNGIGEVPGLPLPDGSCLEGRPRTNQSYIWGLTKPNEWIYFGTGTNIPCFAQPDLLPDVPPFVGVSYACELDQTASTAIAPDIIAAGQGDRRPPEVRRYNVDTRIEENLAPGLSPEAEALRQRTTGLRSAGSNDGVVFIAGLGDEGVGTDIGVNFFAFDAETGAFLGAKHFPEYKNIRKWLVVDNVLYTGVLLTEGAGALLRWRGTNSTNEAELFRFEIVGIINAEIGNLALHRGRIFMTTWGGAGLSGGETGDVPLLPPSGVFFGPPVPRGGYTSKNIDDFEQIFSIDQYEVDPGVEKNSQLGDLASFRNDLYFGSQHLPGGGLRQWADFYNDGVLPTGIDLLRVQLGTLRGASVWRLVDFDTPQERVQLLYGDPVLTLYRPDRGRFTIRANNLGLGLDGLPRYGLSGWNNPTCNHYYWINQVHQEELFVSSFDECALIANQLPAILESEGINVPEIVQDLLVRALISPLSGADLWRFYSRDLPPLPDTLTGAGNKWNYGFRTMWSDQDGFFLGSANPHNLAPPGESFLGSLVSPTGIGGGFGGGWELLEREPGLLLELTDFLAIGDVDVDPANQ